MVKVVNRLNKIYGRVLAPIWDIFLRPNVGLLGKGKTNGRMEVSHVSILEPTRDLAATTLSLLKSEICVQLLFRLALSMEPIVGHGLY